MLSTAEAGKFRTATVQLASMARRDLSQYFGGLDLARPEAARDGLLAVVPALSDQYGSAAAALAAEWYRDMRSDARVGGTVPAKSMAAAVDGDQVAQSVRWAAGALFTDDPAAALALLIGSLSRYVMDYSRQQVLSMTAADREAVGWKRITRTGACGFCEMLASRGGVYSDSTAFFASHDHCHCAAAPEWDADAEPVSVDAYRASRRRRSAATRAADNRRVREWIAANGS